MKPQHERIGRLDFVEGSPVTGGCGSPVSPYRSPATRKAAACRPCQLSPREAPSSWHAQQERASAGAFSKVLPIAPAMTQAYRRIPSNSFAAKSGSPLFLADLFGSSIFGGGVFSGAPQVTELPLLPETVQDVTPQRKIQGVVVLSINRAQCTG